MHRERQLLLQAGMQAYLEEISLAGRCACRELGDQVGGAVVKPHCAPRERGRGKLDHHSLPIALYKGSPVTLSQATVVSRWLVMPTAAAQAC